MKYTVRITVDALADMEQIFQYIAYELQSIENAKKQYTRISNAILSLELNPERCRCFDTEPEHSLGIRKLIVDNYLVCYVVDPSIVTVVAVLYGASDIQSRLQTRTSIID